MNMPQLFQLNQSALHAQAEQAKKRAESYSMFKNGGETNWYKWQDGDNIFRVMPPYSQRGLILREVGGHFGIDELKAPANCITITHPDVPQAYCPVCKVLEEVSMQFPNASAALADFKPRRSGNLWVIDRKHPEIGPQILRLSSSIADKLIILLANPEWQIADVNAGVDIIITKKGSGKYGTEYGDPMPASPNRTPLGPSPEIISMWLSKMVDLDKIFKFPAGQDWDILIARAEKFRARLVSQIEAEMNAQRLQGSGFPGAPMGTGMTPPPPPVNATGYPATLGGMPQGFGKPTVHPNPTFPAAPMAAPGTWAQPSPMPQGQPLNPPGLQQPQTSQMLPPPMTQPQMAPAPQQPLQPQMPQFQAPQAQPTIPIMGGYTPPGGPVPFPTTPSTPPYPPQQFQQPMPSQAQPMMPPPAQTPVQAGNVAPVAGMPECFGGAVPHADGARGYAPHIEKCLLCPSELQCVQASAGRR